MTFRFGCFFIFITFLTACSFSPTHRKGGYYEDDGPGRNPPDVALIPDAVPKREPLAASGNKPYAALGKNYVPVNSATGYRERGVASWYGKKFHGNRTSSGEPYDMYAMTAAHRTLPLPTFVRVTNLQNGKSVVVRVNDRGPFLHNRVIDLSYAAAAKLGIAASGTGLVEVEALDPGKPTVTVAQKPTLQIMSSAQAAEPVLASNAKPAPEPTSATAQIYVQAGAFSLYDNAATLHARLKNVTPSPAFIQSVLTPVAPNGTEQRVYRVRVGPLPNVEEGDKLTDLLAQRGVTDAILVVE
jgi:rare lipoprotein A